MLNINDKELIPWSDVCVLGIAEIDAQHKKMVGMINKLYSAMQESTEKETLKVLLAELADYADYHFSTEEKYFKKFNYDDTVAHTKSHEDYKNKIAAFTEEYYSDTGDASHSALAFKILGYLQEWWLGHILGADRKYVECFHEHGLK